MRLRERFVPGETERGNVMLAAAMMLAVLVVLVALGLTLAPTGSDGITDESADDSEFNVVESGLEQAVFVESNDTLDPAYDPEFTPPNTSGPAPIDDATIAALLASEPFTDEQVVQIQSLLTSLGYRGIGGDIAALEPVAGATETGVLVRLGNLEPRDLGDTDGPLVENATAVRDLELVFERTTLPRGPENATTTHVGNWTLAAYQNSSTDRVYYQLGQYDPDAPWDHTGTAENLHVSVHEGTVNGAPVTGGLGFDPGEPPVDVQVVETNRSNPAGVSTHGGLSAVAVGAGSADVNREALSPKTDWQEVVTRPVFNTTYLDTTTTLDTRLAVDARYRHFEYAHNGTEPFLIDVSLAVETADRSSLDGQLPAGKLWLPEYTVEPVNYTVDVVGTYSNGTVVNLSDRANVTVVNRTDSGPVPCAADCVDLAYMQGDPSLNYLAVPHTLTDIQLRAEHPDAPATVRENLTIVDPYIDTELAVATDSVGVGSSLGSLTMALEPRKQGLAPRMIPAPNISELDSVPAHHAARGLAGPLDITTAASRAQVAGALGEIRALDATERSSFLSRSPSQQAAMLGASTSGPVTDLLSFFDASTTCGTCRNVTSSDAVGGPPQSATPAADDGPQSQVGLVYRGSPDIDIKTFQQLHRDELSRSQNGREHTRSRVAETKLLEFGTARNTLADPQLATQFVETVGWADTSPRNDTAHLVLRYIELFRSYANTYYDKELYDLPRYQLRTVAEYVNRDHITNAPPDFKNKAARFLSDIQYSMPLLVAEDYDSLRPAAQHVYWWLADINDTQIRDDRRQLVAFGGEDQPAVARSSDMLFDIADYTLLDQQALDRGEVELATLDELVGDWTVTMDGTYTGYEFANYSATDPVTVEDRAAKIEELTVTLDTRSLDPITKEDGCSFDCTVIEPPTLYSGDDGILQAGDTADITTTVTRRDGSTEINPSYVDYSLLGPSFTNGPCTYEFTCANYTGPTTPDGFATLNERQHTLTAHKETGLMQASYSGTVDDDLATVESGPLVLEASVNGTQLTDTVTTSVVDLGVSGYLEPSETVELYAEPSEGSQRAATDIFARYVIRHSPSPAAVGITDTAAYPGETDWRAARSVPVPDNEYSNTTSTRPPWVATNETNVSYFTGGQSLPGWSPDEGGLVYNGPANPDGPEEGYVEIWYNESDALDVADSYAIDEVVNSSTAYLVHADANGCSNCGGGSPPSLPGSLSVVGSKYSDGRVNPGDFFSIPVTTLQNEQFEINETVDPSVDRSRYDTYYAEDFDWFEISVDENEVADYYLWSNAGALAEAEQSDLITGKAGWRNETGCDAADGCTDTPNGIIDHIAAPSTVLWESEIQSASAVPSGVDVVADSGTSGKSGPGQHNYEITFTIDNSSGTDIPDTVEGTITFRGFKNDWGMETWIEVPFEIETTDDDSGGSP